MNCFRYQVLLLGCFLTWFGQPLFAQDSYLYVGTFTTFPDGKPTGSEGIYVYGFNSKTGKLDSIASTEGNVASPGFIALSPDGQYLYCGSDARTKGKGSVSAFLINADGSLAFINKQPSGGDNPIYVEPSSKNEFLYVANFLGSNFAIFELNKGGSIGDRVLLEGLQGKGTDPKRQEQSHPHMVTQVPGTSQILLADFGTDKVILYDYSRQRKLELKSQLDTTDKVIWPASGPRHIAFHPNGKYFYLAEEMSGTVAIVSISGGRMDLVGRVLAHDAETKGPYASADIHFSKDGRFLYVSNRGNENNIAIFKVDAKTGKLTPVGYQSTLGTMPRNFTIDPSGNFLLVANQNSGDVTVFKINHKTGLLSPTGYAVKIPQPTCLKMVRK
ncbi:MAG: lactonase family protein [Chitinophagales bacterium]|nr:lactonase family protein [Chitinophagales bacterium]